MHVYLKGLGRGMTRLGNAVSDAYVDDLDLRILTGISNELPYVVVKVGDGEWSAPIYSDDDPDRG